MVRLYEARLVLRSPAIVTARRTERGYVKPLSYIPGSALRGAILTALFRAGRLGEAELEKESREPTLLASSCLPLVGDKKTLPATPFMGLCKLCDSRVDVTREAADALASGREPAFTPLCPRDGCPLEPLHGRFVYNDGGTLRVFRPSTFRVTSVGISKERGAAVKGLLFDYEAIAEGAAFWCWVAVHESLTLPGELEVAVGRGRSRGFGWADLKLKPVEAGSAYGEGVFVALSPLAPVEQLSWQGQSVRIRRIIGREGSLQLGWDYRSRGFRPIVNLARPGSLVVAGVAGSSAALKAGLPVEVAGFKVVGLNSIIPVSEYLSLLGVR